MIKIIIPIISLDSILMIKHSGSGTPNDDQKHAGTTIQKNGIWKATAIHRVCKPERTRVTSPNARRSYTVVFLPTG